MKHEKYIFEMCPDSPDVIKSAKRFEGLKGKKKNKIFIEHILFLCHFTFEIKTFVPYNNLKTY